MVAMGSIVALVFAPRAATTDARPLVTYLKWIAISALVGTSVMVAGLFATWMVADESVALAAVLAVVLWLGAAIPLVRYARRARKTAASERPAGKWR